MTLQEKASLCSGADFWHTKAVKRLGIPSMMVSDGPHGLRKQNKTVDHLGFNKSIKAVCFPTGCALAASFDRGLMRLLGETIGNECQAEGIGVILGPAVNIKRSPMCGRNFEYFSEDPYLAGQLASNYISGVQSKNVGTSIKHFFANSQEHRRMSSSSEMDERTAREIYLPAFEEAIKNSQPWTVMCSYNRINGIYAAQNKKYLTDILRDEWGFKGFVVSDWGAVNNRVLDLEAGLDLEMPSSFGMNDKKIVEAVESGKLSVEVLNLAVKRILTIIDKHQSSRDKTVVFDREVDHEIARKIAQECFVLLKNNNILPLHKKEKTAFIGAFAKKPRYQGGGSSHINASKVENAYDKVDHSFVSYSEGYDLKNPAPQSELIAKAVELAKQVKVAVVFAGLPDSFESEGFDRAHMRLPDGQNALIEAVAEVNSNTVVVLQNGSPVEMPWADKVGAILETYLGGQAVGGATVNILYGNANPSGHLAETFPLRVQDTPSYLFYRGEGDKVEYREGVFVGYRYYDKKEMQVLFPFGHGLSYTTFAFSNMKLDKYYMKDTEVLHISLNIKNTGKYIGKEVVQIYVAPPGETEILRAKKELKEFAKIELYPSETKEVTFNLGKRAFSYYNMELHDWIVENGSYTICAGDSSRHILCKAKVKIKSNVTTKKPVTFDTTIGDVFRIPGSREILQPLLDAYMGNNSGNTDVLGEGTTAMMDAMMEYMPIRGLVAFGDGIKSFVDAEKIIEEINRRP